LNIVATAHFRFYAELNNFLAPLHRQRTFSHPCSQDATVKHMIEALGVPHTEVALISVNDVAVDFSHRLQDGERVSVYPAFCAIDLEPVLRLRPDPPVPGRFIADAHLGQLAKGLRMLGFDVLYRNDYSDAEVARIAAGEERIVLTRDRDLLIRKEIVLGCYLHALDTERQMIEVITRFRLSPHVRAFSRCLTCNGELRAVAKQDVAHRVPLHSRQFYERFFECAACAHVYWDGSHVARMRTRVERMLRNAGMES
jgi:uncharacterized protein